MGGAGTGRARVAPATPAGLTVRACAWRWVMVGALALGAGLGAHAAWIPAKAALAQALLARAWARSAHGLQVRKPWPWADVAPVARLSVPRLREDFIVLNDDSGQALAFGPGWSPASALPGTPGLVVISAHRDTQFRFLRRLRPGDRIRLDGPRGAADYRVEATGVVDSRHGGPPAPGRFDGLWLVTCYPFDALVPGGPLRYVVQARRQPAPAAGTKPARPGQ